MKMISCANTHTVCKFFTLECYTRAIIYSFMDTRSLWNLSLTSRAINTEIINFMKESLIEATSLKEWKGSAELWSSYTYLHSVLPENLYKLLFTIISNFTFKK